MKNDKVEQIKKIARVWQIQLNLEFEFKDKNIRMAFKDIGAFCEMLATNYNDGYIGSGSGGMGVDLFNPKTKKAVEVKSCCTIQNAVCSNKDCRTKFNNLFIKKCPICSSTDFVVMSDSRFGISAKEFLNQYNEGFFDNFTLCCISFGGQNEAENTIMFKMEWYKIEFKDKTIVKEQLKYFENQLKFGRKDHCNLLPNSFDFYKLCPIKLDEFEIVVNYADITIDPIVKLVEFDKNVKVPEKVIPNPMLGAFKSLKSYKNGFADVKDFTLNIPYKHKNLGKVRGDTRGKVYKLLK